MGLVFTEEFRDALSRLERGEHLFLTGKAGTGKSTLIRRFLASTKRAVVVAAPTGIAALNVEGYTIHRLFSFFAGITAEHVRSGDYYPARFASTLKKLDTLVIDEASMVRADLFDCLAIALERFGPRPGEKFGGVQLVLVGDLYQLPPVVVEGEREHFGTRYDSPYFFSSDNYDAGAFPVVELTTVFRQVGDTRLVEILNAVREGALLEDDRAELNARTNPVFRPPLDEFWLTLTTTNRIATARNKEMLEQIDEPATHHVGQMGGEVDGFDLPAAKELVFKTGAQIMMLTNDPEHRWVNGTLARVTGQQVIEGQQRVSIELPGGDRVEVGPHTWEITRPVVDAGALRHEVIGSFKQLPFRLAWAITIHKSQGQTLERVVVDLSGGTFADGQLYVALSRCTSLEGLVLRRDVAANDLKVDQRIRRFLRSKGTETASLGNVYLGLCTVGDEGDRWRPRPVEIALITDDGVELSTLVNPTRDLGAARTQYGITAGDVQLAPLLTEAWAALAPHLSGRTPVGISIDRDLGYLDFELKRNGYVAQMPVGTNIDDDHLTAHEVQQLTAPTAMERARALQNIAKRLTPGDVLADVFPDPTHNTGYLMPRFDGEKTSFLVGAQKPASSTPGKVLASKLRAASMRVRLDPKAQRIARAVGVATGESVLDNTYTQDAGHSIEGVLVPGARICFTGTAYDPQRRSLSKEDLKAMAVERGLQPVENVTKAKCDALISAEAGSQSGKAQKAAQWGKPVFTAEEFLGWASGEMKKAAPSTRLENQVLHDVDIISVPDAPTRSDAVTSPHSSEADSTPLHLLLPVSAPALVSERVQEPDDAFQSSLPPSAQITQRTQSHQAPALPLAAEETAPFPATEEPALSAVTEEPAVSPAPTSDPEGTHRTDQVEPATTLEPVPIHEPDQNHELEQKPVLNSIRDVVEADEHSLPVQASSPSGPSSDQTSGDTLPQPSSPSAHTGPFTAATALPIHAHAAPPNTPQDASLNTPADVPPQRGQVPGPRDATASQHPLLGPTGSHLPKLRPQKPSNQGTGALKFHLIMGAIFIFLTVGMLIVAVIGAIVAPDSVIWFVPTVLAWLAAIIQVPVWIIWGIVRRRRLRR